jgi:hypothetical protein
MLKFRKFGQFRIVQKSLLHRKSICKIFFNKISRFLSLNLHVFSINFHKSPVIIDTPLTGKKSRIWSKKN